MPIIHGEISFSGIKNVDVTLEKVIEQLDLNCLFFEIKLMLTEAVTNAFEHGNRKDETKPIFIRYMKDSEFLTLEVQDSGEGPQNIHIPCEIDDESLMSERGRGLYLISCFTDEVVFRGNTLIMRKHI